MTRDGSIGAFLARSGFGGAATSPLAQDASFRRYLRLSGGPRPAVLMDAPPPEDIRPFLRIAAHLRAAGLSVPDIIAADETNGLLLEEDLGDQLLSALIDRATRNGSDTIPVPSGLFPSGPFPSGPFEAAVDALVVMQRASPPDGLPEWDSAAMARAALGTLFDWWWPAMFGAPAPDEARADVAAALDEVLQPIAVGPRCFVHRDFFAGNLIWMPDRSGARRTGIIDFQGAAMGHPAYDLASLLQDARRDIPATTADAALDRYLRARPDLDPIGFRAAYDACAAQRHLRVACQWVRLAKRDGRPQYLAFGPRTWQLLQSALTRPAVAALAGALDRWIPLDRRCNPPGI